MITKILFLACFFGYAFFTAGAVAENTTLATNGQPKVEVIFCLDTTGSMSGLIEGAKQKIWSIANQIVKGKPAPELRIGLVGYRDTGDEYVTKVSPLDNDLDNVFKNLMSFHANGGGDEPEHVNKALNDSVYNMGWDKDVNTLKLIFLVGDCRPHIDYKDGYDYHNICREAVKKDIIINTIQCGDFADTEKFWREIAKLSEGKYARIDQTGGIRTIETPMDSELAKLNSELEGTIVAYGTKEEMGRVIMREKEIKGMSSTIAAERAVYKSADGIISAYDLIDAIKNNTAGLGGLKEEELPENMRTMSLEEKKKYLADKEKERQEYKNKIEKLSKKRNAYITAKLKETPNKDSFDKIVQEFIKEQANKKGISY